VAEVVEADLWDNLGEVNLYLVEDDGGLPFLGESPIGLLTVYDT
jgi:hypothetical protein